MPSFFYHIVIDLFKDQSRLGSGDYSVQNIHRPTTSTAEGKSLHPGALQIAHRSHEKRVIPTTTASTDRTSTQTVEASSNSRDAAYVEQDSGAEEIQDYRYGKIMTSGVTMALTHAPNVERQRKDGDTITKGIRSNGSGLATKGQYELLEDPEDDLGWGIVRLYRDGEETPGLYDDVVHSKTHRHVRTLSGERRPSFKNEDCTTLCILAVPSYLAPSDFLSFVGEKTREMVSHFRMIRTEKSNRYMVLMKFRSGKESRTWRKEWNGRPFDGVQV